MSNDKRKYLRFMVNLPVRIASSEELWANTRDFSREGMGIVAPQLDMRPGEEVSLKVEVPGDGRFTDVKGRVCWMQEQKGNWYAGIKFEEMDKAAKADILDYAYQRWRTLMSTNYGKIYS